jgi:hypothetical protein
MASSGESSFYLHHLCCLLDELVLPRQLVSSSPFLFFSKDVETSLSKMRLFGYIAVFADDVRDDEKNYLASRMIETMKTRSPT